MIWKKPAGVLAELVAAAEEDCATRRRLRPGLAGELRAVPPDRMRFRRALSDSNRPGFPVIAEVKRASPSAGDLSVHADAVEQATAYVAGGARCLSVLTEARRFGGRLEDLRAVRTAVKAPLLRKDFVVDPYMVFEAFDAGADAVLLIAAAIEPAAVVDLAALAAELGLDVLLEVVFDGDLAVLERRDFDLVGINARDLETLEMDPGRFRRLAPQVRAPGRLLVAESGVRGPEDVSRYARDGAAAVLVGEAAMRAGDPAAFVRTLVEAG